MMETTVITNTTSTTETISQDLLRKPRKSILKNANPKPPTEQLPLNNQQQTNINEAEQSKNQQQTEAANNLKNEAKENQTNINKNQQPTEQPEYNSSKTTKQYPESVATVSQMIAEASKESGGKNSSSSSSYSSPIGSPTPASCAQHCCGSLFGKCAQQHGRCQLLQTFTDTTSPLSRQTFVRQTPPPYYRYPTQRSVSLHGGFVQKPIKLPKNNSDDALITHCSNGNTNNNKYSSASPEPEKFLFDEESVAKVYAESETDTPHIGLQPEQPGPKPLKPILVRRHSSLPNSDQVPVSLSEILLEKGRGRSCSETRKPQPKRPSTPVGELENSSQLGDDEIRYYISESSSSEDLLDEETDKEVYEDYVNEECRSERYSMGNGVANCNGNSQVVEVTSSTRTSNTSYNHTNNDNEGLDHLRALLPRIKQEAKEWEIKADALEIELLSLKRELKKKDQENGNLQREVHKLRSVLQQATSFPEGDLLTSLQDSHGMPGQCQPIIATPNTNKKQGVSGESSDHGKNLDQIQIQRFEKDFRSKQLIKDAIMENDFLKNLDSSQLREIVESMFPKDFPRGSYVIKEGDAGSHLYVSAEGELEVIKENKVLGRMGPRKAFGELAILYNCRRTASIRVVADAKVWVLDRRVFQQIMMRTGLQRLQDNVNFLRSIPLLHKLNIDVLSKISDVLEVEFYPSEAHIIRQGANGDTFFIIRQGCVKVTQRVPGRREEEEIRVLTKGDYFGEQALLKEDIRTANVIALSPGVECLTLDRDSFIQLIGDLSELHEKDYGDENRGLSRPSSAVSLLERDEYNYIRLDDLDVVATLGVGGFGRVELVQYIYDRSLTFALKCLKKQHIVDTQQQEHVYSEKNIMQACNCNFICRLYKTFRDSKYVYMMLEACLGGEVWTILRDRGCFDDNTTKFVTACVLEAFEYLHARGIIYRDLKPENLLLDNHGYVKLVDFGFSKRLGFSSKTWTFCGTPEYVAPEIILNKGHDRAVDYWSLGVLMHELLTGTPPFTASDPMKTYNIILKGIDMVDFPKHITRAAQSLIKRLCRDSPSERLGYQRSGIQDIKKHKWFQGFHWDGLKQRALVAPIIPQVRGPVDTTNFDCYPKDLDLPADEFSNWDADF